MKKTKIKSIFLMKIFLVFIFAIGIVYGSSNIDFTSQTSSGIGSSSSSISVSYPNGDSKGITSYINKGDNSTIIGNYFQGYYYDSIHGYFKLDWDSDLSNNVSIISSTDKCASGYGYKLGGYAYSDYAGLIDFDYNNDVFVYYCDYDNSLHGYSYSKSLGLQNFEGINFEIIPVTAPIASIETLTGVFVNEQTQITSSDDPTTPVEVGKINTNPVNLDIAGGDESIFYIIK